MPKFYEENERNAIDWEKIFANHINKGVLSKI